MIAANFVCSGGDIGGEGDDKPGPLWPRLHRPGCQSKGHPAVLPEKENCRAKCTPSISLTARPDGKQNSTICPMRLTGIRRTMKQGMTQLRSLRMIDSPSFGWLTSSSSTSRRRVSRFWLRMAWRTLSCDLSTRMTKMPSKSASTEVVYTHGQLRRRNAEERGEEYAYEGGR